MTESKAFLFFALICSFGFAIIADDSAPVPAMIWKDDGNDMISLRGASPMIVQEPIELQRTVKQESNSFGTKTIVFYRDSLCVENFKCRQDGHTCHTFLSTRKNLRFEPAIKNPLGALRKLGETSLDANVTTLDELDRDLGSEQFVFVRLPKQFADETDAAFTSRCDRIIEALTTKWRGKNFLYMLTGAECVLKHAPHSRHARDVSQVAEAQRADPPSSNVPLQSENLLVYFTKVIKNTRQNANETLTMKDFTLSVTSSTDDSLAVELKGAGTTIAFAVNHVASSWYVQEAKVNGIAATLHRSVSAPIGFSYKCTPLVYILVPGTEGDVSRIGISGLQIQPRFKHESNANKFNRFGDVNDCTGFTSPGIWSGLIISFLLLSIITLGISWLLDIRTMDRFDDPKGKTITVTATD